MQQTKAEHGHKERLEEIKSNQILKEREMDLAAKINDEEGKRRERLQTLELLPANQRNAYLRDIKAAEWENHHHLEAEETMTALRNQVGDMLRCHNNDVDRCIGELRLKHPDVQAVLPYLVGDGLKRPGKHGLDCLTEAWTVFQALSMEIPMHPVGDNVNPTVVLLRMHFGRPVPKTSSRMRSDLQRLLQPTTTSNSVTNQHNVGDPSVPQLFSTNGDLVCGDNADRSRLLHVHPAIPVPGLVLGDRVRSLDVPMFVGAAAKHFEGSVAVDVNAWLVALRRPGRFTVLNVLAAHIANWPHAVDLCLTMMEDLQLRARKRPSNRKEWPEVPLRNEDLDVNLGGRSLRLSFWKDNATARRIVSNIVLENLFTRDPNLQVWRWCLYVRHRPFAFTDRWRGR